MMITKNRPAPRWSKRTDEDAESVRIVLTKLIPKIDMREPLSDDDRDLTVSILTMVWRGEDSREILYELANRKSRPSEADRNRKIQRDYDAGIANGDRPKVVRGKLAEKYDLSDDRIKRIIAAVRPSTTPPMR